MKILKNVHFLFQLDYISSMKYLKEKMCQGLKISGCFFKAPSTDAWTVNCWQVPGAKHCCKHPGSGQRMAQEAEIFVNFGYKYLWIFHK